MIRQFELVERVKSYDESTDEDALNRAYVFSMKAHGSQKRASGDPYFSHPLEVAGILSEFKLDCSSIITGLLHDTVEDTVATLDQIDAMFGSEVSRLVDGVTKLSQLELQSDDTQQAENFRKLLLAMSQDIRVLLVKLADRMHNMRTLGYISSAEKRLQIARETLEIYAPLAERIGIHQMKDELEDLAFDEIYPDAAASIRNRLSFLQEQGGVLVPKIVDSLKETLAEHGIEAIIHGREKRVCSIWRKMQRKNVDFEQLTDIIAFRVLVDDVDACYRALGVIHTNFPMIPEQFDDYISTPKMNGYQSLHTAVIGPEQHRIEVQIRTREMHDFAELGVAAHWRYKQDEVLKEGTQYRWVRELLDIMEHASGPEEFLEHTKLEMFQDQVFCFTPTGELIALPMGATPIDFAYAVHSEVGDTCVGVKINGRAMPLRTRLGNGDQVEIITSESSTPAPVWEQMVVTGKARTRIRRFVRGAQREEFLRLGQAIVEKSYREGGYKPSKAVLERVLEQFEVKAVEDLYVVVGQGLITGAEVMAEVAPRASRRIKGKKGASEESNMVPLHARSGNGGETEQIPISGLIPGMAVHYANCCHPLPGDRIVGIVTAGKGATVHTIDCETLESFLETPERWLDLGWDLGPGENDSHVGRITLVVSNEPGTMGSLTTVIGRHLGNINNLKITNRTEDFFEMVIDVEVADASHLTDIIAALRATPTVSSVDRAHG
ncbi:MAG: bifunctional (p)ppGpp synthetase/guanosine-3',5'-bis(diphosphate) 3'-pyrophosphohydrolase [Pseudomonadota bacterium]|nr:bifunctional (p)ppGpp synthetase/guanosine-3',5'-bis(diphosphate) 3'-pyrophosphohydrolase [Pseudomonadota bacterium]